jgi:hypothetical protein
MQKIDEAQTRLAKQKTVKSSALLLVKLKWNYSNKEVMLKSDALTQRKI